MKFKAGDKVIPKKFESTLHLRYAPDMDNYIGIEQTVVKVHDDSCELSCEWTWREEALELVEENTGEYFYVGQTVYSLYFQNEERKGVVASIDLESKHPVRCTNKIGVSSFTLDGKYLERHEYISLFQEPIIFPTNKPIVTFKRGEVVEVSDDGKVWWLAFYSKPSGNEGRPYSVFLEKKGDDFDKEVSKAKIRKITL